MLKDTIVVLVAALARKARAIITSVLVSYFYLIFLNRVFLQYHYDIYYSALKRWLKSTTPLEKWLLRNFGKQDMTGERECY